MPGRPSAWRLLALGWLLAAGGCSIIEPSARQVPKSSLPILEPLEDGYRDLAGIIHIHTRYSDGAGTFEEIARVANRLHLDFLVTTDHNTLRPLREGKQGWYGMTLILVGTEISTRAGHYLALNIHKEISRDQPTQAIIDEVNRQGGLGFIAHPYFSKRRWTDWTVTGYTGLEGYNAVHDAFDENPARLALWAMAAPPDALYLSILDRPYDPLAKWDALTRQGRQIIGIGSADAHELRIFGLKIAPYEVLFKLVRTHVLLADGVELSDQRFYDALRRGHAYFSIDLVTDASGFTFMAEEQDRVLGIMGDEVRLGPGLQLAAQLPADGEMVLLRDGRPIARSSTRLWRTPVTEPGVYRMEATLHGKPWIFSNPIYVRNAH